MFSDIDNAHPNRNLNQYTGMAAAISEGTAVTDNLCNLMKNSVVIFESTLTVLNPLIVREEHEKPHTLLSEVEKQAARERFERHFGEVNLGFATGPDNESIDADLAREYSNTHEEG